MRKRAKELRNGKEKRINFWVSDKKKKCKKCKREYQPGSNTQLYCHGCRVPVSRWVVSIRPSKDPVDAMLDEADLRRRLLRRQEGWN